MNKARIGALILRHLYNFKHRTDRWFDAFYWPLMDILLWGLTSAYIRDASTAIPNLVMILLTGLVFWQTVWRSQYEITTNLLEEMWSRNLVNLFATPLSIYEWMVGVVFLGVVKMFITVGFSFLLVFFMYQVNIFKIGWLLLPLIGLLLMSGWYIGFIVSGILVRYGTRIQTLAWSGVYLLAPFSAIYYPVKSLPLWAQKVAQFVPTSYVFEGMRAVLFEGKMDLMMLAKSGGLSIIYLIISGFFFVWMFNKSRKIGLSSVE